MEKRTLQEDYGSWSREKIDNLLLNGQISKLVDYIEWRIENKDIIYDSYPLGLLMNGLQYIKDNKETDIEEMSIRVGEILLNKEEEFDHIKIFLLITVVVISWIASLLFI